MGIMGSDIVAVSCIVAGGALGGLGWTALGSRASEATDVRDCAGIVVTAVSAPNVVVRVGDGDGVILTSPTPPGSDIRIACGEISATADDLRARTAEARLRMLRVEPELRHPERATVRIRRAPALEPSR